MIALRTEALNLRSGLGTDIRRIESTFQIPQSFHWEILPDVIHIVLDLCYSVLEIWHQWSGSLYSTECTGAVTQ